MFHFVRNCHHRAGELGKLGSCGAGGRSLGPLRRATFLMGGTPRPPFQAVCFQFLASFWCFSRSHHKGRCGAEAAQLHRPGLCACRNQDWIFWCVLRCPPLGRLIGFIMVCSEVMGRLCEHYRHRAVSDLTQDARLHVMVCIDLLCDLGPVS